MSRNGGILSGGFNGLRAPSAPAITGVTTSIGSATVAFTPPTDVGDAAVSSYVVTAVDESSGASTGATGSASPITVSGIGGQTVKIRMQALNAYGPGRLTEYDTGNAIYSGAEFWAWGDGGSGKTGLGLITNTSSPVQVGALGTWSTPAAGYDFSLALKTDGTLWAWGENASGQIGNSDTVDLSSPVQIGAATDWDKVSAGGASSAAIKTGGTLWTWGLGTYGRLGHSDIISRSSPVQVGALTNWAQTSISKQGTFFGSHMLAVKTDGTLWAWGNNAYAGQLGDNTRVNRSSPIQIGSLTNWAQVSANGVQSAAINSAGKLYTWGSNNNGRLGLGDTIRRSSPVQVGTLTNWAQVSASGESMLAVKTDSTLWAWGGGANGRLGDNTVGNKSSPIQVGALTNWYQVSAGYSSEPAAIKTDGTLWAWGLGPNGAVGDNTAISRSSPVQIGAETNWLNVDSGSQFHLALYGVV